VHEFVDSELIILIKSISPQKENSSLIVFSSTLGAKLVTTIVLISSSLIGDCWF